MSRVLVVSRNTSVAMALASQDHDVVDRRPDADDTWRNDLVAVDAAVLDLEGSRAAITIIRGLRAEGIRLPIILTGTSEAGWEELRTMGLPAVMFAMLPLSRQSLIDAVRAALAAGPVPTVGSVDPSDSPVSRSSQAAVPLPPKTAELTPELQLTAPHPRSTTETAAPRPTPLATAPPLAAGHELSVSPSTDPDISLVPSKPPRPAGLPKVIARLAKAEPRNTQAPHPPAMPADPLADASDLVRRLLLHTDDLVGVPETAEVVLAEAAERSAADAGCVLLPDGDVWRVAASSGMRPLERRIQIEAQHWLVHEVVARHHGLLVMDSDITRARMANAPLAHWRHFIAVPVAGTDGLILLARDRMPFEQLDLRSVAQVAEEAGPLLACALDLRRLARALVDHCDEA